MSIIVPEREPLSTWRGTIQEPDMGQVRTVAMSVGIVVGTAFSWLLVLSIYQTRAALDAFAGEALPICGKRGTAGIRAVVSEMNAPPVIPLIVGSALLGACIALVAVEMIRRCASLSQSTREDGSRVSWSGRVVLLGGVATVMASLTVFVYQYFPPTTTLLDEISKKA
jgi:hypothetical protein